MAIELGFSHHPKWAEQTGNAAFLQPLKEAGMTALEFTLYPRDPDYDALLVLAEECARAGWRCSLHAPYKDPWNPAGFDGARRAELRELFAPALAFADFISDICGYDAPLVIHGAHGAGSFDQLVKDTSAFLDWAMSATARARPTLENLPPKPGYRRVGETPDEVLTAVNQCACSDLGVCWDFGHSVLQLQGMPAESFLRRVSHAHIHDINPDGEDHFPLVYGAVPWQADLAALQRVGFDGLVIMEINGYRASRLPNLRAVLAQSFGDMQSCLKSNVADVDTSSKAGAE